VLKVPRAVYYRYLKRCPKQVDEALLVRVRELQAEFVGYGYRRVAAQLAKEGWNYSEKQIRRILKAEGLMRRRPRIGKRTTYAKRMKDAQNLVRGANSFAPHELWCCDVTAIRLYGRWAYVAVVLDVCLRKVVGWAVDVRNDARLTRQALLEALLSHRPAAGWIHHSDRGSTYCAQSYVELVERFGGRMSFSDPASPTQNAFAESFFSTFKKEEAGREVYAGLEEAAACIQAYLDLYNNHRLHSSLGMKSPDEYEAELALCP
jgi:putative transposase